MNLIYYYCLLCFLFANRKTRKTTSKNSLTFFEYLTKNKTKLKETKVILRENEKIKEKLTKKKKNNKAKNYRN